jgi:cytochrome o ubiquinol oxidase subunit II
MTEVDDMKNVLPQRSHAPAKADRPPGLSILIRGVALLATGLLGGCHWVLFDPKGDIGVQEKHLILIALGLMLLVVIPVIFLTLYFAWHFRDTNTRATYAPTWSHSTAIEVVVWTIPCLIVLTLAVLIWQSTHSLDPYRPLDSNVKPIRVQVVALNWKWLFIYPDYGVASVNQLEIPANTPVDFEITAESLMNSFFIPQLGSQVYAMPAMQTQLHLIADQPGTYLGRSSAFSGPGFSDMHFETIAATRAGFDDWIAKAKQSPLALTRPVYQVLRQPGDKAPVTIYSSVAPELFVSVVHQYMPGGAGDPLCGTQAPMVSQTQQAGAPSRVALAAE